MSALTSHLSQVPLVNMLAGSTSLLSTCADTCTLFYVKTRGFFGAQPLHNCRFRQCLQSGSNYWAWEGEEVSFAKICLLKLRRPEPCSESYLRWIRPLVFSQIFSSLDWWSRSSSDIHLLAWYFFLLTGLALILPALPLPSVELILGPNRASMMTILSS